jgi:hypothetical protein
MAGLAAQLSAHSASTKESYNAGSNALALPPFGLGF